MAAEPVGSDPNSWRPPEKPPEFIERVPADKFPSRMAAAREKLRKQIARLAQAPDYAVQVTLVGEGGVAAKAGVKQGDIIIGVDGRKISNTNEIRGDFRKTEIEFEVQSLVDGSIRKFGIPFNIETGMAYRDFNRGNPLLLDGNWKNTLWKDDLEIAGLVIDKDPNLAETIIARALKAGLIHTPKLDRCGMSLAMQRLDFEGVMSFGYFVNKAGVGDDTDKRSYFFAALQCYKLDEAMDCLRAFGDKTNLSRYKPELAHILSEHKALPVAERHAPPPSVAAQTLYKDDLMLRMDVIQNGSPNVKFGGMAVEQFSRLRDFKIGMGTGSLEMPIIPRAKNVWFHTEFAFKPVHVIENGNHLIIALQDFEAKDARNTSGKGIGVLADSNRVNTLSLAHFNSMFYYKPYGNKPDWFDGSNHSIDLYALNGRVEIVIDGRRVRYSPVGEANLQFGILIVLLSINADFKDMQLHELLTTEERKLRVDSEINNVFRFGRTRLAGAVRFESDAVCLDLLARGADPTISDDEGLTPLSLALLKNRTAVVDAMLAKKPTVDLIAAAVLGDVAVVQKLMADAQLFDKVNAQFSLLHSAAAGGHVEMAKFVLEKGCKLDARTTPNQYKWNALVFAVRNNRKEMIEFLIQEKNIESDHIDSIGRSALEIARAYGSKATAELIEKLRPNDKGSLDFVPEPTPLPGTPVKPPKPPKDDPF